jgi:hypothetical protein
VFGCIDAARLYRRRRPVVKISLILAVFCTISISNLDLAAQKAPGPGSIIEKDLIGFEKCSLGKKLISSIEWLHKNGRPVKREESLLSFAIQTNFMGMPVTGIEIGICEGDGSRDCGWGAFIGLEIPLPLKEAAAIAKKKTGIDYTIPKRSKADEGAYTLRPLLAKNPDKKNESVLFCDPGEL